MLTRCYSESERYKFKTYENCVVCKEWLVLSTFKEWFDDNYVQDWHLDKDILSSGVSVYSPTTCCYIPQELNKLFNKRENDSGTCQLGVQLRPNGKYRARVVSFGKRVNLGHYGTEGEAIAAYTAGKRAHVQKVVNSLRGTVSEAILAEVENKHC